MQAICVNRNRYFITLFFVSLLWANLLSLSEYKLAFANEPDDTGELQNSFLSKMQVGGYLKNETAYRFDEPRTITKLRNIFELNAQFPVGNSAKVTASGWAYYDLAYDLFDYETIAARFVRDESQPLVFVENLQQEKDSPVAEIRELYLDIFTDKMDIRAGKQFVVWGVLEGMRIVDEINPMDFRELINLDLLDYRIPLWTLKLDYYYDENTSYEMLWIPDLVFHKPAPPGSEWELLQEVPNTTFPSSHDLSNSEFGFKLTKDILDAEITLSYFYTWDDFPVIFRTVDLNSATDPIFFPTYTRMNMYGATFTKPVGATILKGEFAYVPDKYFGLSNDVDTNNDGFLDSNGEVQKKHIRWGLGIDFNVLGTDISPAIAQWIILDYEEGILQDQYDTSLAVFIRKPLPEKSMVLQMLIIRLINLNEMYVKPKVTFDVTDHFQISTGFDLYYGARSILGVSASGGIVAGIDLGVTQQSAQFFGNFHDNDRVFFEFKYTF
jgi:Protein of unknown function (DUF1302)